VLIRGLGATTNGLAQGLVDYLDRNDVPVRVDPQYCYQYGDERTAPPSDVSELWYVSYSGSNRAVAENYPRARNIASTSPLGAAEEHELQDLQRSMRDRLRRCGDHGLEEQLDSPFFAILVRRSHPTGIDQSRADRIAELNEKVAASGGCRCLVVAFPAKQAPDLPFTMGY